MNVRFQFLCADQTLPEEGYQDAADAAQFANGSTEWSDPVYDSTTVPGRKLADPFRADNRAGLSGA